MRMILGIALSAAALFAGQDFDDHVCSVATLRGDYGFTLTGTRPSSMGGPTEQVVGVALTHFDGAGNLTQIDNTHGSINGTVTDRSGTGTYTVNPDCSGTMTLNNEGAPAPLELRIVIVDHGREVRTAVMSPAAVMVTSNGRKR